MDIHYLRAHSHLDPACQVTPLYAACHEGNSEVAKVMCQMKADINMADETEETPLFAASRKGKAEIVELQRPPLEG